MLFQMVAETITKARLEGHVTHVSVVFNLVAPDHTGKEKQKPREHTEMKGDPFPSFFRLCRNYSIGRRILADSNERKMGGPPFGA